MSKFDELCKSFEESRRHFEAYRDEHFNFADQLIRGLIEYFEIPQSQIKFRPADGTADRDSNYTMRGAMHLGDDTFWHLGIIITFYEKPDRFPHQPISFDFRMKKKEDKFIIQNKPQDKEHIIDPNSQQDFTQFYDNLFDGIRDYFSFQAFLEKEHTEPRRIGF
jgi:hypothetical protein